MLYHINLITRVSTCHQTKHASQQTFNCLLFLNGIQEWQCILLLIIAHASRLQWQRNFLCNILLPLPSQIQTALDFIVFYHFGSPKRNDGTKLWTNWMTDKYGRVLGNLCRMKCTSESTNYRTKNRIVHSLKYLTVQWNEWRIERKKTNMSVECE